MKEVQPIQNIIYPKDAWDTLSLVEKAEMMKMAIKNGITDLSEIRNKYNEFAEGGDTEGNIIPFEQRTEVIITPDAEYNQYLNTLPDNQRFTPNDKYDSYFYWRLNGRPKNFEEAVNKGMFNFDNSDKGYHANSIAFGPDGIGYFMKPKTHDTVGYELDWYNKGLVTEEGGKQRPVTPKEAIELEEFRRNYFLTDDPDRPNYYRYQPKTFAGGGFTDADVVDWLIQEEGFNKKPENIGDGKITLGSGLTSTKWHNLYKKRGNKWSAADNRRAVTEEVANRRKWAEKNIPHWDTLPESSQKALLSYKYNYDFNRSNSPMLFKALERGDLKEAARQMDATSKDPKFKKGLLARRKREQNWFLSDVDTTPVVETAFPLPSEKPVSTAIFNPYIQQIENTRVVPVMIPNEDSYVTAHRLTESEDRRRKLQDRMDAISNFNKLMQLTGISNTAPLPFVPTTGNTILDSMIRLTNAEGGKIHIKPENRGKFTALKERTGHSATWFKEHGTPAQKKMATFALNARHWKHAYGGELDNYYDDLGDVWNFLKSGVKKVRQKVKDWGLGKSPAQHLQEKITPTADKKYRQNLYNIVDPTSDIPSGMDIPKYGLVALAAKYGADYPYQRTKIDSVADAAWAKRLGLDYNQSALIDNGDGTVRLPSEIEAEIPTDTTALKNRIASNEKRLKQVYGGENTLTKAAIDIDKQALEALRKTYKTGEPVMMDEHSHVSRNWQGLTPESDIVTPLNTLHRYTVQYDKDNNRMKYWDWYDFNEFEDFVPGNPYKIQGSIDLNKKK